MAIDVEVVAALLGAGADPELRAEDGRQSLLCFAALNGHHELVQLLVAAGAAVNKAPQGGSAPIIMATFGGDPEIVRFLADNGADLNLRNSDSSYTPICIAAISGSLEVVRVLVEAGGDINQEMDYGATPLTLASRNGCLDTIIKYLVGLGAETQPRIAPSLGERSPIYHAVEEGHLEVVQW